MPTLALVEIGDLSYHGTIALEGGFLAWVERVLATPNYRSIELTWEIVVFAERLRAIRERTDRLIAATAAYLGQPLITRDPEIARAVGVEVVW